MNKVFKLLNWKILVTKNLLNAHLNSLRYTKEPKNYMSQPEIYKKTLIKFKISSVCGNFMLILAYN